MAKRCKQRTWKIGDYCWVYRERLAGGDAHKFAHPFIGPQQVYEVHENGTATIGRSDGFGAREVVHQSKLYPVAKQMLTDKAWNGLAVYQDGEYKSLMDALRKPYERYNLRSCPPQPAGDEQ